MRPRLFPLLLLALSLLPATAKAQRVQQQLGRGAVAVANGTNVLVSWRRLAADPEDAKYSVYVNGTKLTTTKNLCYSTTSTKVPVGAEVTVVCEGREGVLCTPFVRKTQTMRNIFVEINFEKAGSPLKSSEHTTSYVWPVDLDGDGEMDYVVNRLSTVGSSAKVEGYLRDGHHLWTVDLGPNELSCSGQDDQICAFDIDCDGRGELIVQTSDGTRFWDKEKNTWGAWLLGKQDTDGDGIVDYNSHATRNAPRYMTVVDGLTGAEKATVEQTYNDAYNRTNKAGLMGDEYNKHVGHVGVFFHDGVHPAVVMEWHTRFTDGSHHYYNSGFAYEGGQWKEIFCKPTGGATFHQIRIGDVDGDGRDEMIEGGYTMDHDGSTLFSAGIAHGDRFRTSDIDPERPGLETFAILQNSGDMLGQILYDAGTGEAIKKWYLPAVGDVGRGECMDVDPNHLGWEMWSTMGGRYDAKGNLIEGADAPYPCEGIWWDGNLDRENVGSSDSHYNVYINDVDGGRIFEPAKESGWTVRTVYAKRAAFWGDIIGDWREELILLRMSGDTNVGIVGISTDISTTRNDIYCLLQDPHYCGDCTTKGYYQSPNPGFYLGYDMPRPQLPPCMTADETTDVFGIALGDATVTPREGVTKVYAMPVKGQTLTLGGAEVSIAKGPSTEIWKSQQGTLVMPAAHSGDLYITEGSVKATSLFGTVNLRARGTLTAGYVDTLVVEGALHYEGCRLMPEGEMYVDKITLPKGKNLYVELTPGKDNLHLSAFQPANIKGNVIFTISDDLAAGSYLLIDGGDVNPSQCKVRGLKGKSYSFEVNDPQTNCGPYCRQLILVVHEQREATTGVLWTGANSTTWDYQTSNFSLNGEATEFVAGDQVEIGDEAVKATINLPVLYPTGGVTFTGSKKFTVQGDGGFSGKGDLTVDMSGSVVLNAVHSDYTGKTRLLNGTVTVKEIADQGIESSLGAGKQIEMARATLIINNTNSGTNRTVQLTDTATISIASGSASLKGLVSGNGTLLKTGAGQLNITYAGANSWKETILQAGTLAMGAWNTTFGKANSPIHVTGNATITVFNNNSTSAVPTVQNSITIDKGKTLTFHAGQRCAIKGSLLGEGTYKIDFPYVRGDVSTNCSKFEGVYEVTTSNCRFVQAMDLSKATLKLDEGSYAAGFSAGSGNEATYTHKIGTLTGSGTLGSGTWVVSKIVATATPVTINGTLKLSSPTLDVTALCKKTIKADAEIKVFNATGTVTFTGTPTFLPETPKDGYVWDYSTLKKDGTLRLKEAPDAIEPIEDCQSSDSQLYDLGGRKVSKATHGIYIQAGRKVLKK